MWTDYEHYTSSPRNPIPHLSDFSRWLCHPRNKQKSPVGAQGLGWQFPLCRDLSPKSQVHIIQQNFSSILIAYVLSDVKCCGCSTVLSSSLLFTSIIVQRLKDFVIWSVIAIIAQAGHKKRRKKTVLMQIMAVRYHKGCEILQTGSVSQTYLTSGQKTDTLEVMDGCQNQNTSRHLMPHSILN